ncbi:SDR family NAD(P)-dependent oxidoreductase [Aquirhabdus parva]|uniref:SDR family NAD(P)-dependent oxidoreductase n=1 Tax=Aquirhabdus parva TaxID=2283318 RepID=A0A345PA06_9GAMM|nr:SDR family NAD(P)-dependent oxidoreductase [Aquirhabdus parva]AXI04115.1 SDR family NAD(P)-dependent oxidoreductase [Aquirhabdus parva]
MSHHLKDFNNKLVLVTGAGSGIGRATALKFADLGAKLVICDRHLAALEETAQLLIQKDNYPVLEIADVSDWQAMQWLADRVHAQHGVLDVLVNNAGVASSGDFLSTPIEDWRWLLDINVMGVVHGCKAFGAKMAERKSGHIVNLASMAGYYAAPEMAAYSASKHAVMGLSESLRIEFAEYNIGVSAICPGVINTNIVNVMRAHGAAEQAQAKIADIYRKRNYGPELVAEAIVGAIIHNRAVVPVSPEAWAMYAGKRFTPSLIDVVQRSKPFRKLKDYAQKH